MKKIEDLGETIKTHEIDICLCSETWETEDESMDFLIESLEQTHMVSWIGRGRAGRRGGGVSVVVTNNFGSAQLLEYFDPKLEIVWVAITPTFDTTLTIIVAAFYSSSSADFKPEEDALQNHCIDVMEQCDQKFPKWSTFWEGT